MNFTISTSLLSQGTVTISFLAMFIYASSASLVSVCSSSALTAFWFQHPQIKSWFYQLSIDTA
jgi:hypothetical protein